MTLAGTLYSEHPYPKVTAHVNVTLIPFTSRRKLFATIRILNYYRNPRLRLSIIGHHVKFASWMRFKKTELFSKPRMKRSRGLS